MKIMVLTPSFLPRIGGLEFAVHHLSVAWGKQGHDVLVVNMLSGIATHPDANYSVKRINPLKGGDRFGWHIFPWNIWMERQISWIIKRFRPDYISGHFAYPAGIWLSDISSDIPWSITCHAGDIQVNEEFAYGYRQKFTIDHKLTQLFQKAHSNIVLSQDIRSIVQKLNAPETKTVVIPNGADVQLRDVRSPADTRLRFNIPANAPYILSVGTNYFAKGFDSAIASFAKVSSRHPDTYYLFLGKNTFALNDLANACGVGHLIRTCENLTGMDLNAAYQQATLFLSSSRIEGFSLVGAEATMAGLPLLVTDCPGNRDLVEEGVNGILCPVDNIEIMAEKINLLLQDTGLRQKLAKGSYTRSHHYEWDRIAQSYLHAVNLEDM